MISRFAANLRMVAAFSALYVLIPSGTATAAEKLEVTVDRASLMKAPAGTATVVIGNPLIADATTQRSGVLVVTGKSFGTTNIMLLNAAGDVLSETLVHVGRGQDGMVMVQRGSKRETFACSPRCEPVLAIGDNADSFGATASQINQRSGMSTGTSKAE